jgi:hypothetical protein
VTDCQNLRIVYGYFLHYAFYGSNAHVIANFERSHGKEEKASYEVSNGFSGSETQRRASDGAEGYYPFRLQSAYAAYSENSGD